MFRIGRLMGRNPLGSSLAATLLGTEADGVALDFRDLSVLVRDTGTPANNFAGNVNSWLTYTSPSTKWILGSNGLYSSGTTLRTEYNASGTALGVRIEPAATNLFLNSRTPATQVVTVAGATYTISGVGGVGATITLTGTGTGTLTGTGAVDRDKLTVVCTAGSLTLTVAGTWDFVQVETGSVATTPIVTAGSTVIRAADNITRLLSAMPYNAAAGYLHVHAIGQSALQNARAVSLTDGTAANRITIGREAVAGDVFAEVITASVAQASLTIASATPASSVFKAGIGLGGNDVTACYNGGTVFSDATVSLPTVDRLVVGALAGGNYHNSHIKQIMYVPRHVTGAENQAFTI